PRKLESNYEKVNPTELEKRFERGETLLSSFQDDEEEIRFSLAGAQDKLAVYVKDRDLFLPQGNSPSTHILKPPSKRFPHVPEAECLMSNLARAMGLETSPASIVKLGNLNACLIERYDRVVRDGRVHRLHQEDFCQALGVSHKAKYERDQGPTFGNAYECVETHSQRLPEDLERITKWLIFNVAIGNCDAHAKNLSLLRADDGEWTLSPHYDFVPTRVYPKVSKLLAMSIGGTRDSGTITATHWKKLAQDIKFGSNLLLKLVREIAESAPDHYATTAAEFKKLYGDSPILQPIEKVIHEQTRRLLSQLEK
ncbi:MAG: HipA domain-containing protein, partial [Bdellovibrionota bacterium]